MSELPPITITQTDWTGDKESMIAKHEQFARDAAAQGAGAHGRQREGRGQRADAHKPPGHPSL